MYFNKSLAGVHAEGMKWVLKQKKAEVKSALLVVLSSTE